MLALAGCSEREPQLMNIRSTTNGPDEFGILPPKALELPENLDMAALPEPTPGAANRTDPTPNEDAIIALGGRPGASGGVPAADSAIYNHANRFGLTPGIRQTLADEDLAYRQKHNGRVLERLFNVNVYFRSYKRQSLDQQAELQRWRRAGVRTPSAPPPKPGE
jgi:hypothetical protein